MMQTCRVCKNTKSLAEFPKNSGYKLGVASICKPCSALQVKKIRTEHPYRYKATKFNTTEEHMKELLAITSCEICGDKSTRKYLAVDHDHKTGKIRGMLCDHCNTALGKFKDDINIIHKAIKYLERSNENNCSHS